jgi:hypothetical protein
MDEAPGMSFLLHYHSALSITSRHAAVNTFTAKCNEIFTLAPSQKKSTLPL